MRITCIYLSTIFVSCLVLGSTCSIVAAQQTASADLFNDLNNDNNSKEAAASARPREKSTDHGFSTTDFLPTEDRKNVTPEVETKTLCRVVVNVPRNVDAKNTFTFYPYPMKPPKIKTPVKGLGEEYKDLKTMLVNSGYVNRTNVSTAYPYGGWRWQYCYKAAQRKSGLGQPHVISEMYRWTDDMMPYVIAETKRSNIAEKDRKQRYMRAETDYEETRVDLENDSLRKGLFPVDLNITRINSNQTRFGQARLLPGSWWLTGTHKAAGLTYYWSMPIEIEEGVPQKIELTEANALVVDGAW